MMILTTFRPISEVITELIGTFQTNTKKAMSKEEALAFVENAKTKGLSDFHIALQLKVDDVPLTQFLKNA